jgi:hypothetical protein
VAALISIILITGSPFQITNNLLTNNENFPIKIIGQDVYGQGDDGGGGDDGGDDSSDSDYSGDWDDGGDEADDGGEESDESEELETSSEETTEEEEEPEDYNPNNVDSDGDGLYDDEEPTEEEIKASEGEDDTETNNEDRYRDITTAGEDVEGFERFVEEKKGNDYNFEKDYHWESAEDQSKLEKEFNDMKLKRAGEDLKPSEQIPIKGGPVIVKEIKCDGEWKNGKCEKDNDKPHKKVVVKKYYKDDDNDDDDDDVKDLAAYNMGYRNGKVDKLNKMPFNDEFPFDDKDGKTWYKVGYRSGWDSGK